MLLHVVLLLTCSSILYQGRNKRGTNVFTWAATSNETSFAAEISPLLQYLWRNGLVDPSSKVGLVEFGSEAFHSRGNVTFSASGFDMELRVGEPPGLAVEQLPATCSRAVSLHLRQGSRLSRMSIFGILSAVLYVL